MQLPVHLRLLLAFLGLITLALVWQGLALFPGLRTPVEIRNITTTPDVTPAGNAYHIHNYGGVSQITGTVQLRPGNFYRLRFTAADVWSTAPVGLVYDLVAPGYDRDEQQGQLKVSHGVRRRPVSVILPSGDSPGEASLRILCTSPCGIKIQDLGLERYGLWFRILRAAVLGGGIAVLIYLLLLIRTATPRLVYGTTLAGGVLALLAFTSPPPASDAYWNVATARSLLASGDTELSEFCEDPFYNNSYTICRGQTGTYNWYPIGMPLLSLPAVFVAGLFQPGDSQAVQVFAARLIFAGVIVSFFLLSSHVTRSHHKAALLTLIFALATPNFPVLGGGLWTHGGTELLFCCAVLLLWRGREQGGESYVIWSALPLALSYLTRPSSAVVILIFTGYVFLCRRAAFPAFAAVGALVGLAFFAWSYSIFAQPLPPYYTLKLQPTRYGEALAGHLFSPNRGLFIWAPFFLFSLYGLWRWFRGPEPLLRACALVVPAYILMLALWPIWWAGFSVGPRLLCDMLPFLTLALAPPLEALAARRNRLLLGAFVICVAFGLFVEWRSATSPEVWQWNFPGARPKIDQDPSRAWDWRDLQFLRGL